MPDPTAALTQYREARRIGDPAAIAKARLAFGTLAVPLEDSDETRRREVDEQLAAALDELPADASREAIVVAAGSIGEEGWKTLTDNDRRRFSWAEDVASEMPPRLMAAHGMNGAILVPGEVGVLAGEGGIAKSALALSIACRVAGAGSDTAPLFDTEHGTVLFASFEDVPGLISWRLRVLVRHPESGVDASVCKRIALLDLKGRPLFGPFDAQGGGWYNARPVPLAGWWDLWAAAREMDPPPKLIVIDPALCAYVGDANAVPPVREFLHSLSAEAREIGAGVLLVAHSTKGARRKSDRSADAYDPGQIGGSAAWTDGGRAALTMTWQERDTAKGGSKRRFRCVAVTKANYGPSGIWTEAMPIRAPESSGIHAGHVVGFRLGPAGWRHGNPDAEIVAGEESPADAGTAPSLRSSVLA